MPPVLEPSLRLWRKDTIAESTVTSVWKKAWSWKAGKVVVESRESCRFECDLLLNRLLSFIGIDPSVLVSRHWKWQHFQHFLIDRSYSRCNLSILASKHHPPTL
ncbi:MAG: hypothetical protein LLG04_06960 [Parachlamydia sp.]|nr:hypothetical protein [Parachlamydia sp.]